MKRIPLLILVAAGICMLQQAIAQQAKTKPGATAAKAVASEQVVPTTLGRSAMSNGNITKQVFDSLVREGIVLHGPGKIKGFNFTYAERMLYEDSAGNPMLSTDYLIEHCLGDSLTTGIRYSLFDRSKPGDTVYFNQIKVVMPSGEEAHGAPMKFLIVPPAARTRR